MTPEAILAVGAIVAGATELLKRYFRVEGGAVLLLCAGVSVMALLAYAVSYEPTFTRALILPYLATWVNITGLAVGIYEGVKNAAQNQAPSPAPEREPSPTHTTSR